MMITQTEIDQVKEIILLLKPFKVAGEKLGKEKDVTITLIMPIFDHLKNKVLKHKPGDSNLIKSMKTSMKTKLENRYTEDQMELLTTITFFDPRHKTKFNVCPGYLGRTITKFVNASNTDYIEATQGQEMHNLSNFNSARHRPDQQATDLSPEEEMENCLLASDEDSQENHTSLSDKIDMEIKFYSKLKFTDQEKKKDIDVLKWWKDNKTVYPCLFETAMGLLHTPATSVPSEKIFLEAGYIAHAWRSKILPVNLDKHLFIKKNLKYVPTDVEKFTEDIATKVLQEQEKGKITDAFPGTE